jgi:hypothetical protein
LDATLEGDALFLDQLAFRQKMERRGSQKVKNEDVLDALVEQLMEEMKGANAMSVQPVKAQSPKTKQPGTFDRE